MILVYMLKLINAVNYNKNLFIYIFKCSILYIGKNHDLCPLYFLKDNKKYGYKYNNFVTLSHCECDKIVNIFILILKGFNVRYNVFKLGYIIINF